MIIAIASSVPLVAQRKDQSEDDAKPYLDELQAAIESARKRGARLAGGVFVLETAPGLDREHLDREPLTGPTAPARRAEAAHRSRPGVQSRSQPVGIPSRNCACSRVSRFCGEPDVSALKNRRSRVCIR